jgi:DNA gyrase/topoisomerase IV subunit A
MSLVNGAIGLGVGWKCEVPPFNLDDIIKNIKLHLEGKEMTNMIPWYRGFTGSVRELEKGKGVYVVEGVLRKVTERREVRWQDEVDDREEDEDREEDREYEIKEIPPMQWTEDYVNFLKSLCRKNVLEVGSLI